jgi:RimJ/RimL family protein N-acetyltransferase
VQTEADMRRYIELALQWQGEGTALPFAIVQGESGQVVGTTRFHHLSAENRRAEIGFTWIAVPWQGSGVNTEAKYLMLRHAFEEWGCIRVEFKADAENEPSRRALEKIGATYEATLRRAVLSADRGVRDLAVYSILAAEWPTVEASLRLRLNSGQI